MVSAGIDATLPSGRPARQLGGDTALNPFLTAGALFRRFQFLGDIGYTWRLRGPDVPKQLADGDLAAGFRVVPRIVPFVQMRTETGARTLDGSGVQFYLPWGPSLLFGVEKPITRERDFNTQFRVGLVWDLPARN